MTFTLQNLTTAVTAEFSTWAIDHSSIIRSLASLAPDTLTFRQHIALDDTLTIRVNDTVRVLRDGVGWFYGRVTRADIVGETNSEHIDLEVQGPWWWLDNLIYQQIWRTDSGKIDTLKSRLIFGHNLSGTRYTNAQQIARILEYAQDGFSVPITTGTIFTGIKFPYYEMLDITCGDAIRNAVRWTPDAVSYFDYSTSTPTLHILRRAGATTRAYAIGTQPLAACRFTPRHDLKVPGVYLKFERTNTVDGNTYSTVEVQSYGANAVGTLVMTIQLSGSSESWMYQSVTVQDINTESLAWWTQKFPWLADATGPDGTGNPTFDDGATDNAYTREIIAGACPPWLSTSAAKTTVTAKISYAYTGANGSQIVKIDEPISCTVLGTSLLNNTYAQLVAAVAGESVPEDVAEGIYNSLATLQYDGQLVLLEDEITDLTVPSNLINVTSGQTAWATMAAQVQRVIQDLGNGQTTIIVGPAQHLSPQNFIELARLQRNRRVTFRLAEREDAAPGTGAASQGPAHTRLENASAAGLLGSSVTLASNTDDRIKLSIADIAAALAALGADIKLRELKICDDTDPEDPIQRKIMVLASQMYD